MIKKLIYSLFFISSFGSSIAQSPTIGGYNVYYGTLHNHSTISGAIGTPTTAYDYAKNTARLDFFGLSDHSNSSFSTGWTDMKNQANAYNEDSVFITFYGFEWTSSANYGHVTVVNTDDYCTISSPTNTFEGLVTWLASRPNGIAFFNHPGREDDTGLEFSHFTTKPSDQVVGMELWNGGTTFNRYYNDGYFRYDNNKGHYDEANSSGWKIGASGSGDDHSGTWGTAQQSRLAILADTLTRADLLAAMQVRRFFSTLDKNLSLSFKINGMEMGSTVIGGNCTAQIQASDADGEIFNQVILYDQNHNIVTTWPLNTNSVNVSIELNTFDGDYYYVKVRQADGNEAISSPIYIKGGNFNIRPSCSISVPENGIHIDTPQSITIAAEASDADGTVVSVEFFVNSNFAGSDNSAPYFINYTLPDCGRYYISAKVKDDRGYWTTTDPVAITVGTFPERCSSIISHEMDDIEENSNGSMDVISSDLELAYEGLGSQTIGLRFTGLNIPIGTEIDSAFIQFTVDEVSSGTCKLFIKGHDADDSELFTSAVNNVSGRIKTSAEVIWEPADWPTVGAAGTDQKTPDLSSIIQEIVDRPGYTITSAISIIIIGTGERTAEAYEGSPGSAALLTVYYTVGMETSILSPAFDETHVRIYPNPVSDSKITIEINGGLGGGTSVTVFDIHGRIYHQFRIKKSETVIDVSGMKSGLYIVRLSNSNKIYSYKLLVK